MLMEATAQLLLLIKEHIPFVTTLTAPLAASTIQLLSAGLIERKAIQPQRWEGVLASFTLGFFNKYCNSFRFNAVDVIGISFMLFFQ